MSLTVLDPGLDSRIVDMGRPRARSLGVPVGGAADRRSLALGNSLIGNPPDAAALEITLKGPHLRAESEVGCILFGAPFETTASGKGILTPFCSFTLYSGATLQVGGASKGARAYLCVRGGFHVSRILDSRSALRPIQQGDVLPCDASVIGSHSCPEVEPTFSDVAVVAALSGLQASWFDEAEFFEQTYAVTAAGNRMGLRLQGNSLTMPKRELLSEPVCPGAVQVTPNGQTIVLGVDGQTIGGYPKIAQVIHSDLDILGQLRPGQRVRFARISLDEATRRDRDAQADLRQSCMRLRLSLDAFPASS
jgi:5-oxoprolinase (ATP-hydrolysing) subunit C